MFFFHEDLDMAMQRTMRFGLVSAALLMWTGATQAQEYETKVVARDLLRPTGIAADSAKKIYFTQLPTPGINGAKGGKNTVSVLNSRNGKVIDLVTGEPEPTNLSVDFFGEVYWTCKTAGVINSLNRKGKVETVLRGLDKPSGISVYPLGVFLLYTEVPTPGVRGSDGGRNTVSIALVNGSLDSPIDSGDPEPTDVAVALNGDVYWTCSSAGVIVRKSGDSTAVILRDLERPTGIALDHAGNLYFTEVPTPGVNGANGGRNAVYKYNLKAKSLIAIDEGDPEPTDITALSDGTVYWTCSSAGVIVEAKLKPKR